VPRRRLNFAKIHARNDALVWKAIRTRPVPKHNNIGLAFSRRPGDFAELAIAVFQRGDEFGYAFAHFLDEFYLFRRPNFFEKEPPASFSAKERAFLAATAEYLSREFQWEPPAWTEKPEYFLPEEWDYVADLSEFPEELRPRIDNRRKRATPEFLRHGIIYEARGLLRL
jgi:hypothetical protein